MKLLTAQLRRSLPALYATEKQDDPWVVAHFFTPDSNWDWWVTEGSTVEDDFHFFGLVRGHCVEFGYFALSELEAVRGPRGLPIERDR